MDIILNILSGILALLIGLIVIWIIYEISIAIYHKTLRYEQFPSTAKVCKMEYEEEYSTTTMVMVGKTMIPQTHHHAEEHNVYLMYDDEEYCFDDENLYNSVNVGDIVRVIVHKGYNKHDVLKHLYLSLEE